MAAAAEQCLRHQCRRHSSGMRRQRSSSRRLHAPRYQRHCRRTWVRGRVLGPALAATACSNAGQAKDGNSGRREAPRQRSLRFHSTTLRRLLCYHCLAARARGKGPRTAGLGSEGLPACTALATWSSAAKWLLLALATALPGRHSRRPGRLGPAMGIGPNAFVDAPCCSCRMGPLDGTAQT